MMMTSAKLAHLVREDFFTYYEWVSLVDIDGLNHDYDVSKDPTLSLLSW